MGVASQTHNKAATKASSSVSATREGEAEGRKWGMVTAIEKMPALDVRRAT
jgi:hypothetical protein